MLDTQTNRPPENEKEMLIIDDSPELIHLYKTILSGEGWKVEGVSSGDEALAYLQSNPSPSIILLDFQLGAEDGLDVALRLKEFFSKREKCPTVIGLSSHDPGAEILNEFKKYIDDCVEKPNDISGVVSLVATLDQAKAPRSAKKPTQHPLEHHV